MRRKREIRKHRKQGQLWLLFVFSILLFLGIVGTSNLAMAEEGKSRRRWVNLDWEPVEDASQYQVEITRILSDGDRKKPVIFKVGKPEWKAKIVPGSYEMRLRSFDARRVPGPWSKPMEFWVKLKMPNLISPAKKAKISSEEGEKSDVAFSWEAVEGAKEYRVEVKNKKGEVQASEVTSDSEIKIELPVAQKYKWRVIAIMPEGQDGEVSKFKRRFSLYGQKLETPKIQDPETEFVQKLSWKRPEHTEKFYYKLSRFDAQKGKWKRVEKEKAFDGEGIDFKSKYPGGKYRLIVRGRGKMRPASDKAKIEFQVREGLRTPAAMDQARLKESIESKNNFYFVASYLLTMLDYEGENPESGGGARFDALGGTGRLGVGYFNPKSKWGGLAIVDLAGFDIGEKNETYASGELHGAWRMYFGTATQLRVSGGLYFKDVPEVIRYPGSDAYEVKTLGSAGPHLGFQLWHPLSYKLGIQVKARGYVSVFGSTPNGNGLQTDLSYQAGFLGSYRISRDMIGFAGYLFRQDNVSYDANPGDPSDPDNTSWATAGQVNEVSITGHYLNLVLEWSF